MVTCNLPGAILPGAPLQRVPGLTGMLYVSAFANTIEVEIEKMGRQPPSKHSSNHRGAGKVCLSFSGIGRRETLKSAKAEASRASH